MTSPRSTSEPLVRIGQGDSAREIREEDCVLAKPTPWAALVCLWLAFAVLAWLWSLLGGGR